MEQVYKFNELTNYPVIIAQLKLSLIVTALVGVGFSQMCPQQTRPALRELQFSLQVTLQSQLIIYSTLYAAAAWKADDIVEASSELDGIIIILGGFRCIHNERYMDMNTFERLLMLHTIEHMLSGHAYARALSSHFLTATSLTALVLDASSLMDEIDVNKPLTICSKFSFVMYLSRLQCHSERSHPKANRTGR